MYITARQTQVPWFCLILLVWLAALTAQWETFGRFLQACPVAAAGLSGAGVLVAGAIVAIRPSAAATFAERIEMWRNGCGYLLVHPLLGLGPDQWWRWNMHDGDTFFQTLHIHNLLLHTGVELGLIALAALLVIIVRHFVKSGDPAAFVFLFHNMMDITFFNLGVTSLTLVAAGEPQKGGVRLSAKTVRVLFAVLLAHFAYVVLYMGMRYIQALL